MIDAGRWQHIRELFGRALELEPGERQAFLDSECSGDEAARDQIELLIASLEESGDFLEQPAGAKLTYEGARIGPYELVKRIGQGGMGMVYLAVRVDEEFQRRVAIKLLQPGEDSEVMIRRFRGERQILAALDHPNIAKLLDGGTTPEGLPYLVMEYIEGRPIDEYCDARGLGLRERLELLLQVGSAVQFAHGNLVVHRDLKPANILVTAEGVPKLLDFGIAKLLNPELVHRRDRPTATVFRLMTPEYASPEQLRGEPVATASDVYSLGVLLYKLVTGKVPFAAHRDSPVDMIRAVCEDEPLAPSAAVDSSRKARRLQGDVDNIVLEAVRKKPSRRYASVERLLEDIRRYLDGRPVLARKNTLPYRAGKFARRHRLGVATAAVFVLACLGFGVVMAVQRSQIAAERDQVARERNRAESALGILVDLFESADPWEADKVAGETVTAREVLDRGAVKIEKSLADDPELQAEMMLTLGKIFSRLGLNERAKALLEPALVIHRKMANEPGERVANNLDALGVAAYLLGDLEIAERHSGEALEILQGLPDADPLAVAASFDNLGDVHAGRGDYTDAIELYELSLATRRQHLETDDLDIADSLNSLANVYLAQGRLEEAESYHRQSYVIRSKLVADDHPVVAINQQNLAGVLFMQGKLDEARPLWEGALETYRLRLGEDHLDFINVLGNLGSLYLASGELQKAEDSFRQILENYHPEHRRGQEQRARAANRLGTIMQKNDRPDEAETFFRQALAILREEGKSSLLSFGMTLTDFAVFLKAQRRAAECEDAARESIDLLKPKFGEDHGRIAYAEMVLAGCLVMVERFEEAEKLLLHSQPILAANPAKHAKIAEVEAVDLLITVSEALGRSEQAQQYRELQQATRE